MPNHLATGETYHYLGKALQKKDKAKSLENYNKAIDILSKIMPLEHPIIVSIKKEINC